MPMITSFATNSCNYLDLASPPILDDGPTEGYPNNA